MKDACTTTIVTLRLTGSLYRSAYSQERVSPFNGFSTWRRSSLLFGNSAAAVLARRAETLHKLSHVRECDGCASHYAARSKSIRSGQLSPRAQAFGTREMAALSGMLAIAVVNSAENRGCECGGGRGRGSGERRTPLTLSGLVHRSPFIFHGNARLVEQMLDLIFRRFPDCRPLNVYGRMQDHLLLWFAPARR